MGVLDEKRFAERPQFFYGQRLFADDLQELEAFNREMRWLHNRSLHQYGVGSGLAVSGAKGDREVGVGPGYAIDALGREIVLTQAVSRPVPPVAGDRDGKSVFFDLAVSYADDDTLQIAETREGVCLPAGAVRLREIPSFCWIRLERDPNGKLKVVDADTQLGSDVEQGLRLVLARAEVQHCQLVRPISAAPRHLARPPRLPRIAAGEVIPTGDMPKIWMPWTGDSAQLAGRLASSPFHDLLFAFSAEIKTGAAGFENTPNYSAQVRGPRVFLHTGGERQREATTTPIRIARLTLVLDQLSIQNPCPDSFTAFLVCALVPLPTDYGDTRGEIGEEGPEVVAIDPSISTAQGLAQAIVDGWGLTWMGVEQ